MTPERQAVAVYRANVRGVKVILTGWEWRCCGEPFAIGSGVEWNIGLLSPEHRAYVAEPLGDTVADAITHAETHHGDDPLPPTVRARVEAIWRVTWDRAPRPGDESRTLYAVPGTGVVAPLSAVDRSVVEDDRDEGYLVDLQPLD
jgi:hypothetical protein